MKVLLSAYACAPGSGSEPEVGFRTLVTAARQHEVWLLTRENNVPDVQQQVASLGLQERIHIHGFDIRGRKLEKKKSGLIPLHRYYDLWQRGARDMGLGLHSRVKFDVAHHVTFASYWTRTGVAAVPAPLVWGPVGGTVKAPLRLFPTLGAVGVLEELGRNNVRKLAATRFRSMGVARQAAVVLVQNPDIGHRLAKSGAHSILVPNATSVDVRPSGRTRTSDVVFIGRLIPWKAGILAVHTLRYLENPDARLVVFGRGPDRGRMERAARSWDIEERVRFEGRIPRSELMERLSVAGALLHPSLHDEASFTVAEALTLGTPVVCLDRGGPPTLASLWPSTPATVVEPTTVERTARDLARALDAYLADPPEVPSTPRLPEISFEEELLKAYRLAADQS